MSNSTETKFTKKDKIIIACFTLVFSIIPFAEEYLKFNSTLRTTQCGKVIDIYIKEVGRSTIPFFDLISDNGKTYKFAYADTNLPVGLWIKSLFDSKTKDNVKLIKNLKVGDRLCVTYSLKYQEGSILLARPNTPYIIQLELSNVTK